MTADSKKGTHRSISAHFRRSYICIARKIAIYGTLRIPWAVRETPLFILYRELSISRF